MMIKKTKSWMLEPPILALIKIKKDKDDLYIIWDIIGERYKRSSPEEIVRQAVIAYLIQIKHYPKDKFKLEYPVQIGSKKTRADIAIVEGNNIPSLIVETKTEISQDSENQLRSYMMASGATFGLLVDYNQLIYLARKGHTDIQKVIYIPEYCQNEEPEDFDSREASTINSREKLTINDLEKINQLTKITKIARGLRNKFTVWINEEQFELPENGLHSYNHFRKTILMKAGHQLPKIEQKEWENFLAEAISKNKAELNEMELENSGENQVIGFIEKAKTINYKELFPRDVVLHHSDKLVLKTFLYEQFLKETGLSISKHYFHEICSRHLDQKRTSTGRYYVL